MGYYPHREGAFTHLPNRIKIGFIGSGLDAASSFSGETGAKMNKDRILNVMKNYLKPCRSRRNLAIFCLVSALAAPVTMFGAPITPRPSRYALLGTAASSSSTAFNFSEASQRGNNKAASEDHTGKAPVPEPSTWIGLGSLLLLCAAMAASTRAKKLQE